MKSFSVKKRNIESWRRRKFYIKCDLLFISKLEYEAINISRFKNYIMFKRFIYSSLAASGISCFVSKNINPKDKYWRDIKRDMQVHIVNSILYSDVGVYSRECHNNPFIFLARPLCRTIYPMYSSIVPIYRRIGIKVCSLDTSQGCRERGTWRTPHSP